MCVLRFTYFLKQPLIPIIIPTGCLKDQFNLAHISKLQKRLCLVLELNWSFMKKGPLAAPRGVLPLAKARPAVAVSRREREPLFVETAPDQIIPFIIVPVVPGTLLNEGRIAPLGEKW